MTKRFMFAHGWTPEGYHQMYILRRCDDDEAVDSCYQVVTAVQDVAHDEMSERWAEGHALMTYLEHEDAQTDGQLEFDLEGVDVIVIAT